MDKAFIEVQKSRIEERIARYFDKGRITDELESGDVSGYTRYKQKVLVPILQKILNKIVTGDYGTCENCGKEIEMKRLQLVPAAEYCISCMKR